MSPPDVNLESNGDRDLIQKGVDGGDKDKWDTFISNKVERALDAAGEAVDPNTDQNKLFNDVRSANHIELAPIAGDQSGASGEPTSEMKGDHTAVLPDPTSQPTAKSGTEQEMLTEQTEGLSLLDESLESSIATVKPLEPARPASLTSRPPIPPPKDDVYLDTTPKTPLPSQPPSRTPSYVSSAPDEEEKSVDDGVATSKGKARAGLEGELDEKIPASGQGESEEGSQEIQTIMDQFDEEGGGPGIDEVMSPRLELAGPLLGSHVQHPPRKSSLEPIVSTDRGLGLTNLEAAGSSSLARSAPSSESLRLQREISPPVPPKPGSIPSMSPAILSGAQFSSEPGSTMSPKPPSIHHKPPPPEPDPEPDLPFDFHRFLEQLRHKTADPVAKFLRSFLQEFGKKQWMVHEQVKIISDFLAFITGRMAQCEVWRGVSDAEFDNAREGMEKLVMNRLYTQTFSPAIPPPQMVSVAGPKGKRKGPERVLGPGRRGQHQEDVERDEVLAQKVRIYGWVREEHLDIETVGESGRRFLTLAQQELLKIKTYRAPRDKVICVLNCCKVIFGLLRHSKADQSADSFVPLLIYVVLQANPEHLVSNVQYILRFRNSEKLGGEAGYYLSSLMGAIQFIENLDRTSLTISDDEFERNVEAAVSAIAEKHEEEEKATANHVLVSEKSSLSRPEVTPRTSMDVEYSTPRRSTSSRDESGRPSASADTADEKDAVAGLLRTIQRPLSTIGRIFSEDSSSSNPQSTQRSPNLAPVVAGSHPVSTPLPGNTPRLSPAPQVQAAGRTSGEMRRDTRWQTGELGQAIDVAQKRERVRLSGLSAEEAAARQASAETAEAQRIQRAEHADVVETLSGMFPNLDKEVIDDVVRSQQGRVGLAVEACLALSS